MAPFDNPEFILPPPGPYKPGKLSALGARFSAGVASVVSTVPTHAAWWHRQNLTALGGSKPLWIAVGDSTAQGVGAADPFDGYVGQLHRRHTADGTDYDVINVSVTGARMRDLLTDQLIKVERVAAHRRPARITCTIGANDTLRSVNVPGMTREIREVVSVLAPHADHLVLGALLHAKGSRVGAAFNKSLRDEAAAHAAHVAEVGRAMNDQNAGRAAWASDSFHPNETGYEAFAAAFWKAEIPAP